MSAWIQIVDVNISVRMMLVVINVCVIVDTPLEQINTIVKVIFNYQLINNK